MNARVDQVRERRASKLGYLLTDGLDAGGPLTTLLNGQKKNRGHHQEHMCERYTKKKKRCFRNHNRPALETNCG
jgi:hypothetical protein